MLERVLFVLIVCGVYLGMNWYVLARLFSLFAFNRTIWFYVALIPLTLSFIVALVFESTIGNRLTGAFFTLAMLWLGTCGLLLWILLVQQLLSLVLPIPRRVWTVSVCGLAAFLVVYAFIYARAITVRREQIRGLPFKIAQLSDIHIGSIGESTLADIIAKAGTIVWNGPVGVFEFDQFGGGTKSCRQPAGQRSSWCFRWEWSCSSPQLSFGIRLCSGQESPALD